MGKALPLHTETLGFAPQSVSTRGGSAGVAGGSAAVAEPGQLQGGFNFTGAGAQA